MKKATPVWKRGIILARMKWGVIFMPVWCKAVEFHLRLDLLAPLLALLWVQYMARFPGYIGGRVDGLMMRIVDILIAIPFMFVLILFLVVFGRSILMIFVGIALFSWLGMARVARGQTMTLKNKEFIEAARATGVSQFTIVIRHIVPNLLGIVIVYGSLMIPGFIMAESFISFLGLGVQEPNTSWGALISEGAGTMTYGTIWQLAFPLFFFTVTMFCFYFIGDGLRDAFDPKDR